MCFCLWKISREDNGPFTPDPRNLDRISPGSDTGHLFLDQGRVCVGAVEGGGAGRAELADDEQPASETCLRVPVCACGPACAHMCPCVPLCLCARVCLCGCVCPCVPVCVSVYKIHLPGRKDLRLTVANTGQCPTILPVCPRSPGRPVIPAGSHVRREPEAQLPADGTEGAASARPLRSMNASLLHLTRDLPLHRLSPLPCTTDVGSNKAALRCGTADVRLVGADVTRTASRSFSRSLPLV